MRCAVLDFSEFTMDQGLMDLPLVGGVSMWSNSMSWSRLDWFLVSLEWELSYLGLVQKKLLCVCSDHVPILLTRGGIHNGKHSFKFENMWLKKEGFLDKVRDWWGSFSFEGSLSFILAKKLQAFKGEIKKWNSEEFGDGGGG
jgi:hypothetical protein